MIKKIIKSIKNVILIIILVCIISVYIDYQRMMHEKKPIFNISTYNKKTKIQLYQGFFYQVKREIIVSPDEPLYDSSNIKMTIFNKEIELPKYSKKKIDYTLISKNIINCEEESKLYYADKDIKIYTYCISSLKVKEKNNKKSIALIDYLKENNIIIEDIKSNFKYTGLHEDNITQIYKLKSGTFTNNDLMIYECDKENVNDIYIVPLGTPLKDDFCTYKDDDFSFLWTVEEGKYEGEEEFVPDLFYEDEKNLYELSQTTKDKVLITTPKVRGKPRLEITLDRAINEYHLTLEELKERGLHYNVVDKEEREKEIREEEEEKKKQQEQEKNEEEG